MTYKQQAQEWHQQWLSDRKLRLEADSRLIELEREVAALRKDAQWRPQFDAIEPEQERLAVQFCEEIAGRRGEKGRVPDPVRLLEMAEALYKAEADAAIKEQSKC